MLRGANLFFGALLGVTLVTTDALPTADYAILVMLLAGTVATLSIFSEYRWRLYP